MKKLIGLIIGMVFSLGLMAQTKPGEVAPDGYVSGAAYQFIWNTTADTLTDSDNASFVWRVKDPNIASINIKLYLDCVSGSASGTLIAYHSIDGVHYEATGDTITYTSVTADGLDSEVIDLPSFLYPYLKIVNTQTGTAVTVPKAYLYCKLN